jgi:hypothetical protein
MFAMTVREIRSILSVSRLAEMADALVGMVLINIVSVKK